MVSPRLWRQLFILRFVVGNAHVGDHSGSTSPGVHARSSNLLKQFTEMINNGKIKIPTTIELERETVLFLEMGILPNTRLRNASEEISEKIISSFFLDNPAICDENPVNRWF